jgi:hypothetical protein
MPSQELPATASSQNACILSLTRDARHETIRGWDGSAP